MVSYNELLITRRLRLKELRDSSYGLACCVVVWGAALALQDPASIKARKVAGVIGAIPMRVAVLAMDATYIAPRIGVSYKLREIPKQ